MRRALLVKESNGYYDVNMTDEPCDWQDIIDQATSYRKVDDLQGGGAVHQGVPGEV